MTSRGYIVLFRLIVTVVAFFAILIWGYKLATRHIGTLIPTIGVYVVIWAVLMVINIRGKRRKTLQQQMAIEEANRRFNERR